MPVRGIDDYGIHPGIDQRERPLVAFIADGRGGSHAQTAVGILAGVGMLRCFFHVLDRDQADATAFVIDDDELFEPMLVKEPARLVLRDALADGDHILGHQFGDGLQRIIGETDVAICEDAAKPRRLALRPALDHRNAGNPVLAHQRLRVGERLVRKNDDRIDHHSAFVTLHLADFLGLFFRIEIAMDDSDPARLGEGDREPRFRHRVHGCGDDRQVEADLGGEPRLEIDAARQDFGMARQKQHVVERESFPECRFRIFHGQLRAARHCRGLKQCRESEADPRRIKVGSGS